MYLLHQFFYLSLWRVFSLISFCRLEGLFSITTIILSLSWDHVILLHVFQVAGYCMGALFILQIIIFHHRSLFFDFTLHFLQSFLPHQERLEITPVCIWCIFTCRCDFKSSTSGTWNWSSYCNGSLGPHVKGLIRLLESDSRRTDSFLDVRGIGCSFFDSLRVLAAWSEKHGGVAGTASAPTDPLDRLM